MAYDLLGIFTFFADPLWIWSHPYHLKLWHRGFNERSMKSNYLTSRKQKIDTLIVGSSRSSYMNPVWLGSESGFNYSISSGQAREFPVQIDFVRERSQIPLKFILVEASFFQFLENKENRWEYVGNYINQSQKLVAKPYKAIFMGFDKAIFLPFNAEKNGNLYYVTRDRFNTYRSNKEFKEQKKKKEIRRQVEIYKEKVYIRLKDENYVNNITAIRRAVGDSEYAVYTTPVSKYLLKTLYDAGKFELYEQWLRRLVDEFECVYNFCYPNKLTLDDDNFIDAHHPTSKTSKLICEIISGKQKIRPEYCVILTKDNLEKHLKECEKSFIKLGKEDFAL